MVVSKYEKLFLNLQFVWCGLHIGAMSVKNFKWWNPLEERDVWSIKRWSIILSGLIFERPNKEPENSIQTKNLFVLWRPFYLPFIS